MKRVYLSFPIETLSDIEIEDTVNELTKEITSEIGESVEVSYNTLKREPSEIWITKSIYDITHADIVCFAKGWGNSKKCKFEYDFCVYDHRSKPRMFIV